MIIIDSIRITFAYFANNMQKYFAPLKMIRLWYNLEQDSVGVILTRLPFVSLSKQAIYLSDVIEHEQIIAKRSQGCIFSW